eukprot:TRINITY_DN3918_c0_g1_i3.p1 TRINITY_DN3918_c0_g1~~TRINITY_DN3918_c0_g1_i3.p1  ORF type:complete len:654 (+),score=228.69 TRINITY_DN3918_c0_g1_i3:135-2096(+)
MDELRNLITNQNECGDERQGYQNPLSRVVNNIWDRSQMQQHSEWEQRNEHSRMNNNRSFTPSLSTQSQFGQLGGGMNMNMNNRMNHMNPLDSLEEENFDEYFNHPSESSNNFNNNFGNVSSQVPPDLLKFYLKSFINSDPQSFRAFDLPDMGFSEDDKLKVRNRTERLARQIFSHQSDAHFMHHMNAFLGPINRDSRGNFLGDRFAPNMNMGKMEEEDWANEFQSHSNSMREVEPYHDNFNQVWEQQQKERHVDEMAREFEAFDQERRFEEIYNESQETQKWVDEFEGVRPISRVDNIKSLTQTITEIQDPKLQGTNFMKMMRGLAKGELELKDNQVVETNKDTEEWANEFQKEFPILNQNFGDDDWADQFENEYAPHHEWLEEFESNLDEESDREWIRQFSSQASSATVVKDYKFSDADQNPYIGMANPFQKGIELFDDGKISDSILAFEAELHENPENSSCWEKLGIAHAENDKDTQAIAALNKAVDMNPDNLSAKMALAVSYTNDLYRDHALDTLRNWMERNPEYSRISSRAPPSERNLTFSERHSILADMFMEAARQRMDDPDSEVQVALGLLFNLSMDYDKAVDCFKTAVGINSQDYQLWNKLGATLANSSRSEEAVSGEGVDNLFFGSLLDFKSLVLCNGHSRFFSM